MLFLLVPKAQSFSIDLLDSFNRHLFFVRCSLLQFIITVSETPLLSCSLFQSGSYSAVLRYLRNFWLDVPGIESRWVRNFPCLSRPNPRPTSLVYNGYWVFTGGKAAEAWYLTVNILASKL
jgi:hypothetical protein